MRVTGTVLITAYTKQLWQQMQSPRQISGRKSFARTTFMLLSRKIISPNR